MTERPKFSWPQRCRGAVSFTYDDAWDHHHLEVAPLLEQNGLRGTFYAPINKDDLITNPRAWAALAERGHELGNHSCFHPCYDEIDDGNPYNLRDYTVERWTDEMRVTNFALSLIDGKRERTFGNTCCGNYVGPMSAKINLEPHIAKLFVAARGEFNRRVVDPATANFANLGSFAGDRSNFESLRGEIENAVNQGGWIIYFFHRVGGPSGHPHVIDQEEHRRIVEYLGQQRERIWTAPLIKIAKHVRGESQMSAKR